MAPSHPGHLPARGSSRLAAALGLLAAAGLLLALLGTLAAPADGATIHACKARRGGTLRLVGARSRCSRGATKLSWSTLGPTGRTGAGGADGVNGATGAPGPRGPAGANGLPGLAAPPLRAIRFAARQAGAATPAAIDLFSADGVAYSFSCQTQALANVGQLFATAPAGAAYGLGSFKRPAGIAALVEDIRTNISATLLGDGPRTIAATTTAPLSRESVEQLGVWTVTVEGPTTTTFVVASFSSAATCSVRGTAFALAL